MCGFVCLFVCLRVWLVCLFVCLFVCVFVWLFVCLFVCFWGAGAGAGALFGSFWGPGVVIWSPFWVIWGPFCVSTSGLICSLYVVICVFFEDFGYGKTSKSRRTASTAGGNLLGNTGLALQRGAVCDYCLLVFYANHDGWPELPHHGLRNGRWLGEPLGGGPVSMLHARC